MKYLEGKCKNCKQKYKYLPIIEIKKNQKHRWFTTEEHNKLIKEICPICALDEILTFREAEESGDY